MGTQARARQEESKDCPMSGPLTCKREKNKGFKFCNHKSKIISSLLSTNELWDKIYHEIKRQTELCRLCWQRNSPSSPTHYGSFDRNGLTECKTGGVAGEFVINNYSSVYWWADRTAGREGQGRAEKSMKMFPWAVFTDCHWISHSPFFIGWNRASDRWNFASDLLGNW